MTPIIGGKMGSYTVKGKTYAANFFGAYPIYFEIFKTYKIVEGRGLRQSDRSSCVIGSQVANPRGFDEQIIEVGDRVNFIFMVNGERKEANFRILGILEEVGGTFGGQDDRSVVIPFREAQQIFEVGSRVDFVAITVDETENVEAVVDELEDDFSDRINILDYEMIQQQVDQILGTIEGVLGGIAAISLLVAGVGIINTMTISVIERTREIGILKAVGAKGLDVLLIFLTEATITGIIGGVLGSVSGFILGKVVGDYINLPVATSSILGIMVVGFAVITTVISGLYPAWRASRMNPVDALRRD
jgi:putative ABC transport system permease protein